MKIRSLEVKNIGILGDVKIEVQKPLNLFYGDIRQGKTTILNAVRWAFGGEFPADIIRHGEEEAHIEIVADDDGVECVIRREWYRNKEGETTNRPLTYYRAGAAQQRPAESLKAFLNPFIMDDRYFMDLTLLEQRRFLVKLFNVDVRDLDKRLGVLIEAASQKRLEIKAYGEIIPVEVHPVDVSDLLRQREVILEESRKAKAKAADHRADLMEHARGKHDERVAEYKAACDKIEAHNAKVRENQAKATDMLRAIGQSDARANEIGTEIQVLKQRLVALETELSSVVSLRAEMAEHHKAFTAEIGAFLSTPECPEMIYPDFSACDAVIESEPDTSHIDMLIHKAGAINEQHAQYLRELTRKEEKDQAEAELVAMEKDIAGIRAAKLARLQQIGEQSGVPTLEFLEDGDYRFCGTASDMLSDSQQMELSEFLKGKYPDGLAVSLVDRGESLGKSVLKLVEKARQHNRTILCTVVGDKPAVVPEDVGAFVVEKGVVA